MYAIVFDMDTDLLKQNYHNPSWQNAYSDIRATLSQFGFNNIQGSTYYGNNTVTAVTVSRAVRKLTKKYKWFGVSVRDIHMLRIEEADDLMPIIIDTLEDE
jgi:virulence-associated protein VapD